MSKRAAVRYLAFVLVILGVAVIPVVLKVDTEELSPPPGKEASGQRQWYPERMSRAPKVRKLHPVPVENRGNVIHSANPTIPRDDTHTKLGLLMQQPTQLLSERELRNFKLKEAAKRILQLAKRAQLMDGVLRSTYCSECMLPGGRRALANTSDGKQSTLSCGLMSDAAASARREKLCPPLSSLKRSQSSLGADSGVEAKKMVTKLMSSPDVAEAAKVVRDNCRLRPSGGDPRWEGWNEVRKMIPSVQDVVDCLPPIAPATTCHHQPAHDRYPTAEELVFRQAKPLRLSKKRFSSSAKSKHIMLDSWLWLENVCATCEVENQWFMHPGRPCYTTLYTMNDVKKMMVAAGRHGRHKLYKERDVAFQYGGQIDFPGDGLEVPWVRGTTFYNTPFAVDNVGHVIHDGIWAWVAALNSRHELKMPKPHRVVMDSFLSNFSGAFFTYLSSVLGDGILGSDVEKEDRTVTFPTKADVRAALPEFDEMVGKGDRNKKADPFYRGRGLVCFELLAFTSMDRTGDKGGPANAARRPEVAKTIRRVMYERLSIDEDALLKRHPQVYVYGRNDVYRRSIDNVGALVSAIGEVTATFEGVPPPALISTFYMSPPAQIEMLSHVDILVTMQGAHEQPASLFMPADATIVEISACKATKVSFISRHGAFLKSQRYNLYEICEPAINQGDPELHWQNVTLCAPQLSHLQNLVRSALQYSLNQRRFIS